MINYLSLGIAAQKAEQFIKDQGITELPIDPFSIAESLEILVKPKPDIHEGVSGMLLRNGNDFGILYATHINNTGFQRFSIAHELGHYFLDGHIDHIFSNDETVHTSHAGFISSDIYELEADHFAAGLLMPDPLFSRQLNRLGDGLEAIVMLASLCQTSLTATAIRYTEKTSAPIAIIISTGNHINYCFMSKALREFSKLTWPTKGMPLPVGVETRHFNNNQNNIKTAAKAVSKTDLRDWFGGYYPIEAKEEIIGLGSYGKTLTVISTPIFADEADEDGDLKESWAPRFRR